MSFPNLNGRPKKYTDKQICQKLTEYLKQVEADDEQVVPTIEGLAIFTNTTSDTLKNYSKNKEDFPKFFGSYRRLKELQAQMIINKGLKGDFNSNIAKLMLHNHGYTDKKDVTTGGDKITGQVIYKPSTDEELEAIS